MENKNKKISVIVPVYNVEQYIGKTIESVICQTYQNWELILVDDGSVDNSGRICDFYKERDHRIKVLHQENAGVSIARKTGFLHSNGDFITFLDGDDYLDNNFFQFAINSFIENDIEWVAMDFKEIGSKKIRYPDNQHIIRSSFMEKEELIKSYFNGQLFTSFMWGKVFKKCKISENYFHNIKVGEDTCFMFDIILHTKKAYVARYCGYNYVIRNDSAINSNKFNINSFDLLKMIDYLEKTGRDDIKNYKKTIHIKRAKIIRGLFWGILSLDIKDDYKNYMNILNEEIRKIDFRKLSSKLRLHLILIRFMPKVYAKFYKLMIMSRNSTESRSYYTKKNAIYGVISQILNILLSFVSRTLFIRFLGHEYLGLNGLFTNILSMLSLAELGIGGALTFSLYKPIADGDDSKIQALMRLYRNTYFLIGAVIAVLGMAITPVLPYLVNFDHTVDINYYVIYILFLMDTVSTYFFSAYRRSVLQAGQQEYIVTNVTSVFNWIVTIGQILILIITHNYYGYIIIKTLLNIVKNKIISYIAGKRYPCINKNNAPKIEKSELKEIGKNIYALAISKISSVVYYSSDNIVISVILGTILVGLYSNYYMIVYSVTSVIGIILGSAKASIGNLNVTENSKNKLAVFNKIQYVNFIGYGFAAVCLAELLSPFIKLWLGERYLLSDFVVYMIVANFLISGLLHTVTMFKDACGLFWQTRYRTMATTIVNVLSSIVLAKYIGLAGVFLGTILSYLFTILPKDPVVLFNEIFHVRSSRFYVWYVKSLFITVIIFIVTHYICLLIPDGGWLLFFVKAIVTGFTSLGLFILVSMRTEEFKYFKDIFILRIFGTPK